MPADVVVRNEVAAFDQLDTHLPSKVSVLKVSRVEDSRRKQNDVRLRPAFRRERPQRPQQKLRVLLDRLDVVCPEELREDALHDAAVGQHVADAARHAQIVFQNHEVAVFEPDKVRSADRDVDVSRHLESNHLATEVFAAVNHFSRDDAVGQDSAFVVNIAQKHIERGDPLR